ncbi:MAG: LacI family transcriptional regulator [Actinomycetia bacterium]|nr:LacI family transcriptional regulator [Actinomycetes bacterium]
MIFCNFREFQGGVKIANIKDIAKEAEVSVATVSHVINRSRYVSDKLINRVEQAMKDLDYQPNLLAGSLRKKKTGTIGLIIPDSSNMLFADISKSFEDMFFSKNYNIIVCNSAYDINREIEHLKNLRSKMVDGILMIPATREGGHIEKISTAGIPIVLLDRKIPGLEVDYVLADNYKGGFEAGKYLVSLGHTNIGYIDRIYPHSHSLDRKKGFESALAGSGISLEEDNIVKGGFTYDDGAGAVKKLLEKNRKITAVFSFNDINALGAIRGLADLKCRVPDNISIIGNDDIYLSSIYVPRLTTVHYPVKEIVKEAGKILLARIKEPIFKKSKEILIQTELVIRESTAVIIK